MDSEAEDFFSGHCTNRIPISIIPQPAYSRAVILSPRISQPPSTANTLSRQRIREATVGSVSF